MKKAKKKPVNSMPCTDPKVADRVIRSVINKAGKLLFCSMH